MKIASHHTQVHCSPLPNSNHQGDPIRLLRFAYKKEPIKSQRMKSSFMRRQPFGVAVCAFVFIILSTAFCLSHQADLRGIFKGSTLSKGWKSKRSSHPLATVQELATKSAGDDEVDATNSVVFTNRDAIDSWLVQFLDNNSETLRSQMLKDLVENDPKFWHLASETQNIVPVRRLIGAFLEDTSNLPRLLSEKSSSNDLIIVVQRSQHFMQSKIMSFLHVSKSGGSWLCGCAKQGLRYSAPNKTSNCWSFDLADGPRWITEAALQKAKRQNGNVVVAKVTTRAWWLDSSQKKPSCAERFEIANSSDWTFLMNENFMQTTVSIAANRSISLHDDALKQIPCPQFSHIIQFRQPIDRLLSHYRHIFWTAALATKNKVRTPCSVAEMSELMPKASNNYYIRSILGKSVWDLDLGLVNRSHLEEAKRSLIRHFDAVLILEDEPLRFFTLKKMLGLNGDSCSNINIRNSTKDFNLDASTWHTMNNTEAIAVDCQTKASIGIPYGKANEYWSRFHDTITKIPNEWESLRNLNELDIELYEFARNVAKLDRLALELV